MSQIRSPNLLRTPWPPSLSFASLVSYLAGSVLPFAGVLSLPSGAPVPLQLLSAFIWDL